ncbi:hypothetical protein Y032_0155g3091 [Ancylostoma ceylanicum]|uniref:Uncharacterized protein n=1 Tax=Ancylostoma ceylanicum TaxID=53326 RepID=A0A016T005_9BILA|nr:hypothetical protein Y032_0155g3091 [Ancylostoma ceylanicum]
MAAHLVEELEEGDPAVGSLEGEDRYSDVPLPDISTLLIALNKRKPEIPTKTETEYEFNVFCEHYEVEQIQDFPYLKGRYIREVGFGIDAKVPIEKNTVPICAAYRTGHTRAQASGTTVTGPVVWPMEHLLSDHTF